MPLIRDNANASSSSSENMSILLKRYKVTRRKHMIFIFAICWFFYFLVTNLSQEVSNRLCCRVLHTVHVYAVVSLIILNLTLALPFCSRDWKHFWNRREMVFGMAWREVCHWTQKLQRLPFLRSQQQRPTLLQKNLIMRRRENILLQVQFTATLLIQASRNLKRPCYAT